MNIRFKTVKGESALNPFLIQQQKLTQEKVDEIKELHKIKDSLLDKIEKTLDREILKEIEEVEFKLQDAWGFPQNRSYHSGWREASVCQCPSIDNQEMQGWGDNENCYRIYNGNCPLHGDKVKEILKEI